MLVLSRGTDEIIWIGEEIQIQVVAVGGGKVRLGIRAPQEITVVRSELLSAPDEPLDSPSVIPE